ncbi:hypothetical protein SKAU_G00048770 [Synaphobranchus kaupii]|uniref:Uncharacterized protein n=1 Tax=Synaphobranchus kaupii TaxID=118154 RepID=A0A9Q1J9J8_SYNKA|nr:hypothetical protein SKAU_G00048770 [Synaphobranchus kaupii]
MWGNLRALAPPTCELGSALPFSNSALDHTIPPLAFVHKKIQIQIFLQASRTSRWGFVSRQPRPAVEQVQGVTVTGRYLGPERPAAYQLLLRAEGCSCRAV